MVSILKRLHLISVLFCYFLFFLVLNFTQLSQAYFFSAGGGGGGISVFWNCAQPKDTRTRQANSESVQWIYLLCVWQTIQEANLCIVVWSNIIINPFWSCLRLYR